jgi:hypothetical protein
LSGLRLDFFIACFFVGALLVGYSVDELTVGFGSVLAGLVILLALLFWVCDPRVCYSWTAVLHAESIQGWVSYWKVLWRWGTSYDQVGFLSNPEAPSVTFYYSASTLESLQQLW